MSCDPEIIRGNDGKLYLSFPNEADAQLFLDSLGASETPLHCCDGYCNAVEIVQHNHGLWAA